MKRNQSEFEYTEPVPRKNENSDDGDKEEHGEYDGNTVTARLLHAFSPSTIARL